MNGALRKVDGTGNNNEAMEKDSRHHEENNKNIEWKDLKFWTMKRACWMK